MVAAGGVVDVERVAEEGPAGEDGFAAALLDGVACGVEPGLLSAEEAFAEFLQADDVGIGFGKEAEQVGLLFGAGHVAHVVGDDGECAVALAAVARQVEGTVVEDVADYEEQSGNGHPCQAGIKEQPEEDEEHIDAEEDGEGQRQKREAGQDVGRDEGERHAEPYQQDGAQVSAEEQADRYAL